jgi:hypothetical protein
MPYLKLRTLRRLRTLNLSARHLVQSSEQRVGASHCKKEHKKVHHASKLLAFVDATTVRRAAAQCARLFTALTAKMN